jgi:hypothetical protein
LGDEAKALGDEVKALGDEAKGLTDEAKALPRFVFEYDRALTYYQKSLALKLMKMAPEEGLVPLHFISFSRVSMTRLAESTSRKLQLLSHVS